VFFSLNIRRSEMKPTDKISRLPISFSMFTVEGAGKLVIKNMSEYLKTDPVRAQLKAMNKLSAHACKAK
jgi:hypothetical protein